MDKEDKLMEEGEAVTEDSSDDGEFSFGDPKVEPRVGDEYQVEIPPLMSSSNRQLFLSTPPLALNDPSSSFLIGRPLQITWIEKQPTKEDDDENVDMNQSLKSFKAKRSAKMNPESKKQRLNHLEAVPVTPIRELEESEVDSFVLGMYTFGKSFKQVSKFIDKKGTRETLLFYYAKFYNSPKYHRWSSSRKKRNRKCVTGKKLYSGWRLQMLLSRLIPSITDESKKDMLVNVSKSFAEGTITLESYISAVKDLVGLKLLIDAVAIGKDKENLTVLTVAPMKTKTWFTISSKPSSIPAYSSLTSADIINQLTGCSRLSKARCNDIFYEAVWPRLLARGWHSEQVKDRGYFTSKDNIVFIVPGVKQFSRGKLVKGEHYFDSVSDILTKVASEPELLEFETGGGEIKEAAAINEVNSDEESDSKRHCYLKSPSCSSSNNRGTQRVNFTVVDTSSLISGGKLCDLRNLNEESLVSEAKTRLGDKHSSSMEIKKVEKPQMMPLDVKNQGDDTVRFTIMDTSVDKRDKLTGVRRLRDLPGDETTTRRRSYVKAEEEKVKDSSKRLVKDKRSSRNDDSVDSGPLLKRRRLSACIRKETSLSRESPVVKPPESDQLSLCAEHQSSTTCEVKNEEKERDETVLLGASSDQSKKTGSGSSSSSIVEVQEMSEIKPNGLDSANEVISSEQEPNGLCSVSGGSDQRRVSIDLEQEQALKLPSISNGMNTNGPRRQSTRKRPLTTRALEALESGFLTTTTKRTKSTNTPRKRESSRKKRNSAKACNRTQVLSDNKGAGLEHRGEEDRSNSVRIGAESKPLDQVEDSKPSFDLNEVATAESEAVERVEEHPKHPPIVLKFSLKRR